MRRIDPSRRWRPNTAFNGRSRRSPRSLGCKPSRQIESDRHLDVRLGTADATDLDHRALLIIAACASPAPSSSTVVSTGPTGGRRGRRFRPCRLSPTSLDPARHSGCHYRSMRSQHSRDGRVGAGLEPCHRDGGGSGLAPTALGCDISEALVSYPAHRLTGEETGPLETRPPPRLARVGRRLPAVRALGDRRGRNAPPSRPWPGCWAGGPSGWPRPQGRPRRPLPRLRPRPLHRRRARLAGRRAGPTTA